MRKNSYKIIPARFARFLLQTIVSLALTSENDKTLKNLTLKKSTGLIRAQCVPAS